jgi:hypothetical protein
MITQREADCRVETTSTINKRGDPSAPLVSASVNATSVEIAPSMGGMPKYVVLKGLPVGKTPVEVTMSRASRVPFCSISTHKR